MSVGKIRLLLRQTVIKLKEIKREAVKMRELWLEEMAIKNEIEDEDPDA